MKTTMSLVAAACSLLFAGADIMPTGSLGYPLDQYLVIEGTRDFGPTKFATDEKKTKDAQYLLVDTVNGKKLKKPVSIRLENAHLFSETRYVLRGFEAGAMRGLPVEVEEKEPEFMATLRGQPQAGGCYFLLEFTVTSVAKPAGIAISPDADFKIGNE